MRRTGEHRPIIQGEVEMEFPITPENREAVKLLMGLKFLPIPCAVYHDLDRPVWNWSPVRVEVTLEVYGERDRQVWHNKTAPVAQCWRWYGPGREYRPIYWEK